MTKANTYSQRAHGYATGASDGSILACKWVRLACERHLRDLERAQTDAFAYEFDAKKADRICKFSELLPHNKGKWARKDPKTGKASRLVLEDWQCFILCCIFGWVKKSSGFRRFTTASIYIPRKNGKSFFACVIGWWMFAKDGEPGAEVYCGATSEAQAWEVFRPARQTGILEPALTESAGVKIYGQSMTRPSDGSRFEPVIGKPGDGSSPHCAIVDEYHEHADPAMVDTMRTGMGAREQPLLLIISTAGSNLSGPCRDDWRDCEKLLECAFEDDHHFAMIFTVDEGVAWTSEEALKMANPNWGVSINPEMILPAQQEAIRDAAKQAIFKTKHLNVWTSARNGWMNMELWNACYDKDLSMESFKGQPCWIGIDAAAKVDVFSVVAVFEHNGGIAAFARHFMPEDTIALPQNAHMRKWVAQGHMTATEGARTDQRLIEDVLREWSKDYYVQEVAYDPREISYLMNQIREWAGFPCIEISQGPALMSEPTKELEAKVAEKRISHNGDPVLSWMMSNVIKKEAKGGCTTKYTFLTKQKADQKIDGVVALIMAISRQMQGGGSGAGFGFV